MKNLVLIVLIVVAAAIYFVPSLVAGRRRHHQGVAIFVLNLFLGWSLLGWVAALVWACTAIKKPDQPPAALPPAAR